MRWMAGSVATLSLAAFLIGAAAQPAFAAPSVIGADEQTASDAVLPDKLPEAIAGTEYLLQVQLPVGGQLRYAEKPKWMNIDGATGTISGIPLHPEPHTFTLIMRDVIGGTYERQTYTLEFVRDKWEKHVWTGTLDGWSSAEIPAFTCPTTAPYLANQYFSWNVPRGVRVEAPAGVDVIITNHLRTSQKDTVTGWVANVLWASVTNWSVEENTVRIFATCKINRADGYAPWEYLP